MSRDTEVVGEMQKSPGRSTRHVHFGEVEDILSTSFYNETLDEDEGEESEEQKKKKDINSRVVRTLGTDDVSMLKQLLVEIPELETYLERPLTHLAAQHGALKILQECVSKPADSINAATADFEATTPLYWAITEGRCAVVDWLLGAGAFHQPLNVYQDSAVYVAVHHQQVQLLPVLHKHSCDSNIPNRNGDVPLMHVIRTGDIQALDRLIDMGVDVYGGTRENTTMDDNNATLKHMPLDLTHYATIGPLCAAVVSGDRLTTQAVLDHVKALEWQCQRDMLGAMMAAVISENLGVVDVLLGADVTHLMVTTAGRQAVAGRVQVMRHLVQYPRYHVQLLTECIDSCREVSARCGGYPFCRWDLLFIPHEGTWTVHNTYRHVVQVMAEAGLDFRKVALSKPSPFMEAASAGLLCLVYDLMRYGAGVAVTRKRDKDMFLNVFYTALLPKNRLSGFRRKNIRVALMLASYPLYYTVDAALERTVKRCLASPHDQVEVLQSVVIRLAEQFLFRIHNASALKHLCRTVILTHLDHSKASNATAHLGLPTRLVNYLNLRDLREQDQMICQHMGRVPELSDVTHSDIKRCPCIPVEHNHHSASTHAVP